MPGIDLASQILSRMVTQSLRGRGLVVDKQDLTHGLRAAQIVAQDGQEDAAPDGSRVRASLANLVLKAVRYGAQGTLDTR